MTSGWGGWRPRSLASLIREATIVVLVALLVLLVVVSGLERPVGPDRLPLAIGSSTSVPATEPEEPSAPPSPVETSKAAGLPGRLVIPALRVDARVVPIHAKDGVLEPPHDLSAVGWDEESALPGEPGVALLTGHRDSADGGRGALVNLADLEVGDRLTVGDTHWRVTSVLVVAKDDLPADVFRTTGARGLALITCGGWLETGSDGKRHWAGNVTVLAEQIGD